MTTHKGLGLMTHSLISQLNWRYATKKFDPAKKITPEIWSILEDALVLSPSSYGLQPWKFIVITDPAVKAKLPAISWTQPQPGDCSHMVVFAVRKGFSVADVDHFMDRVYAERGLPKDSLDAYRGMIDGSVEQQTKDGRIDDWMTRQVYIALGNFMTSAALLGVDTCPMEGIVTGEYDQALGLTGTGYASVVGCAAGYRAEDPYAALKKVRFPKSEVIKRI